MSATTRRDWRVAAELGVLALALGTTAGFNRLFIGWAFLGRLAPLVILAWAAALLLRRLRVPVAAALPAHLVLGLVALTVRFGPGTHLLGIPTPHTVRDVSARVEESFSAFSRLIAPVDVTDGFLVVIAAALWIFAFFADTAALRFRGVFQAAVPHVAVFGTVGILARDAGRITAAVWFGLGLVTYAVTQVGRLGSDRRWVQGHATRGTRSLARYAGAIAVLGLIAGALLGPLMPGGTQPVVDLRELGRGDGPRTVVSPFIGIRSLLGQRSDQVVFSVQATEPAYWRLTALEEFDEERQIWVSSGTYANASGELPRTDAALVLGKPLEQSFRIEGLGGVWLPGAYVPDRVTSDTPLSFDTRSASIILRDEADGPVSYDLVSAVPDFARLVRAGFVGGADPDIDPVHLQVPDLSGPVQEALADATGWAGSDPGSDHARMLALQDWFRDGFAYDESVDFSNELDPLDAFLAARRGFCQQFSSAFALMARALGMPTRIAVGFTPGDPAPPEAGDDPDRTRFVVRGRHAHAWPEVHFEGVGWVPFEPTPQRGDPQNREHTGVSPAQAAPPEGDTTTSTTAPGQPPGSTISSSTTTADPQDPRSTGADPTAAGAGNDDGPVRPILVVLGVLAVLGVAAVWWLRRRRDGSPTEALHRDRVVVATAWADAARSLAPLGLRPTPAETPLEFARRVQRFLSEPPPGASSDAEGHDGDHDGDHDGVRDDAAAWLEHGVAVTGAIATLADIETRARFRDGDLEPDEVTAAREAERCVADHAPALAGYSSSERRNRSRARDPALLK